MDNYEQMCEAAQLEWDEPKVGDRFAVKQDLYFYGEGFTTKAKKQHIPTYSEGVEQIVGDEGFGYVQCYEDWEDASESLKPFAIWMPTIEQISEMIVEEMKALEPMIHGFFTFIFKRDFGSPIKHYSYRELHLMYYYYFFKNKLWNGQEFVELEDSMDKRWGG